MASIPIVDLPKHKLEEVISRLAQTIRDLEKENDQLKEKLEVIYRKISHGYTDADCTKCDQ